jgi:hypothetical protein
LRETTKAQQTQINAANMIQHEISRVEKNKAFLPIADIIRLEKRVANIKKVLNSNQVRIS